MSARLRVDVNNSAQVVSNSSQIKRTLLWVSNNKDSGAGSLRDAIEKGNKLAAQGKAIEIAFTDNFTIKPMQRRYVYEKQWLRLGPNNAGVWTDIVNKKKKRDGVSEYHQYTINGGDWLINDRNTKNITIDGSDLIKNLNRSNPDKKEKNLNIIERVRSLIGIGNGLDSINAVKPTRVDITRINLVNNEVKGGARPGTGGSLAAGAAVLHWGGHLTWRDSVIQNNKVSGGIGTSSGAKGGNGWYRNGFYNSSIVSAKEEPKSATRGFHGSSSRSIVSPGLNDLHAEDDWRSGSGQGGSGGESEDAGNRFSKYGVVGRPGKSGANGRRMGQAGRGGGGGGGGGVSHQNQKYERSKGNLWGNGGKGGNGGDGAYGAGGGSGGGGGGNAGTNSVSNWSWSTSRTPSWSPSKPGKGGKGGAWATDGTSGSWPSRQKGGSGGKGGDGAALGTFTSFAMDEANSSLKLNNVDFINNKAVGGPNVGRFRDIFSRKIVVDNHDVTLSSGGQLQESATVESATPESINDDHLQTDKTKVYDVSGRFKKLQTSQYAPELIYSASYTKTHAGVAPKSFRLNPNKDSVIGLTVYHDQLYTHQGEIIGAENLLNAVNRITNHVYKTKTEAEIRGTRGSMQALYRGTENTGSLTNGVASSYAKDFGFLVGGLATEDGFLSKVLPKKGITALGYLGPAAGVVGLIGEFIFTRLEEDQRIERELASKKAIDKEKEQVQSLIPDNISMEPFKLIHEQTIDIFEDFKFGRDQIVFNQGIRPVFDDYSPDGSVYIKASDKGSGVVDNSAKVIAQINLPDADNLLIKSTGNSNEKYFNSLLHLLEFGEGNSEEKRYVLSKDTDWKYLWTNDSQHKPVTGFANDRVVIDRSKGGSGLKPTDPLTISTFSGNDRVTGDSGKNIIFAGSGSDYIAPNLGEDTVDGGPGFDTVDYIVGPDQPVTIATVSNSDVWTVAGVNSQLSLASSLSNVESLRVPGGSSIDLSNAKAPTAMMSLVRDVSDDKVSNPLAPSGSGASPANSSQLKGQAAYLVATRAGSSFTGSSHNDVIYIDLFDSNLSPNDIQKSTVNGGAGANELLIDGFARHIEKEPDGKNYFFEVSKLSSDPKRRQSLAL